MTSHVSGYKGTIDFYGQVMGPGIVKCKFHQRGSDTTAAEFLRYFCMHEHDLAIMQPILQPRQFTINLNLELLLLFVVRYIYLCHLLGTTLVLIQDMCYFRKYNRDITYARVC